VAAAAVALVFLAAPDAAWEAVVVGGGFTRTITLRFAASIAKARSRHLSAVAAIFAGSGWFTRTAAAYMSSKVAIAVFGYTYHRPRLGAVDTT
jgi:hypothetical protein